MLVHISSLISVEVVGHFSHNETSTSNETNATCKKLELKWEQHCDSYQGGLFYWLSLPSVVYVVGQYLIFAAGVEYLCAKTPYSMRGLMFGSVFTCLGLSLSLLHVLFFQFLYYNITLLGVTLGCVFWFLVTCAVVAVLFSVMLFIGSFCYKRRQKKLNESTEDDGIS